ncbi:AIPR family protein [Streptococcus suis]|uniref:AIPR family protein n=1 Tax=Streptococcus suis TaxID=1307 RepID=UPI002118617F|nr:AIPR family protein [Streptococcus suis]
MPTKLETIFNKIENDICEIKEEQDYITESAAFSHYFLRLKFGIDDETAKESLTDGGYDHGIDAIYIENSNINTIHFFQFKFPKSLNGISSGFTDDEIVKLCKGVEDFLTSTELDDNWNSYLKDKHRIIRDIEDYKIKLWNVRFSTANILDYSKSHFDKTIESIKAKTLNDCSYEIVGAKGVCDLYEEKFGNNYPDIDIKTMSSIQTFESDTGVYKSISFVTSIFDLYSSVKSVKNNIFDGNVRFYNNKTSVTESIRKTLVDEPENFILYNNGITIITSKANYLQMKGKYSLKSASIINGAQTVGAILSVLDEYKDDAENRYSESPILVRIIEIDPNINLINNIVYSLNTQTKMFSSYSISNDTRLKEIQEQIDKETEYFLEIKYNEFAHFKSLGKTSKLKKNKIDTEKLFQYYVGYYNTDGQAYKAKLSKSDLIEDEKLVNNVLDQIDLKKYLEAHETYREVNKVISAFRKHNNTTINTSNEILDILSVNEDGLDEYKFINTADILILFTTHIVKEKNKDLDNRQAVIQAIEIIKPIILEEEKKTRKALSTYTKSKNIFEKVKNSAYKS